MDETTHIIVKLESKYREDLYRADGMLVGCVQRDQHGEYLVRFGQDIATSQSRYFLNKDFAKAWLRKLATIDLMAMRAGIALQSIIEGVIPPGHYAATIEERDGESLVTLPNGSAQIALH